MKKTLYPVAQALPPAYIDKRSATQFTTLSARSLDYARERGELPFMRIGARVVFRVSDIQRFMEGHLVDAGAGGRV